MPVYDCGSAECEECQTAFGPDRAAAIADYERREKHFAMVKAARKTNSAMPCHVCLSVEKVAVYDAANHFLTICPECCENADHADGEHGHGFEYDRHERMGVCTKCGQPERDDTGYISDRERI